MTAPFHDRGKRHFDGLFGIGALIQSWRERHEPSGSIQPLGHFDAEWFADEAAERAENPNTSP